MIIIKLQLLYLVCAATTVTALKNSRSSFEVVMIVTYDAYRRAWECCTA